MSHYLIQQLSSKQNVNVESFTEVTRVFGKTQLESILTVRRAPGIPEIRQQRKADALFLMIGADADTQWLPAEVERDENGFIRTGLDLPAWTLERPSLPLETGLPGLFCAGDVRHGSIKRVSSGVGEGSMAISSVHQYLSAS